MANLAFGPRSVFASLGLLAATAAWWGCAGTNNGNTSTGTPTTSSSGSGGSGGATSSSSSSNTGGFNAQTDGGGGAGGAAVCTSTSAAAHRVPLDMIFLIDQSGSMHYAGKWAGTTMALTAFFNDPESAGINAGMVYMPFTMWDCNPVDYETLTVPIAPLPGNAFALINSMPADAHGIGTPMFGALQGTLVAATAYQDAHPLHKVVVVMATDGDPDGCTGTIDDVANLAKSALNYNGVLTYVIGAQGSIIPNLDKIAAGGGTTAAYDITTDITLFSASIAAIRQQALGCDFSIPPPPKGGVLDPDEVNFSYAPNGGAQSTELLRAKNLADCGNDPGWYYDNNASPTRILLCPASCSTVEADPNAKVEALFGCKSLLK